MTSYLPERAWFSLLLAAALSLTFLSVGTIAYAQEDDEAATATAKETAPESDISTESESEDPISENPISNNPVAEPVVVSEELGIGYAFDNGMLFFCAVLVFFMQAGFAMVEAGFNSSKNVVNILFKNSMDVCVGVLLFFFFGFGIMYPYSYNSFTDEFKGKTESQIEDIKAEHKFLEFGGVGLKDYTIGADRTFGPEVDWFFQAVFAATAATIVSGAVAGRMKVGAYLIYSAVLTGLIYPVSGFWKWGGGWLAQDGFQDFAGSAVVHGLGGFAGLAGAIVLGPRLGRYVNGKSIPMLGHSVPLAALGVFILWFGWYGFNPGSQLAFHGLTDGGEQNIDVVMHCAVTTTLAAGAGGIVATLISWLLFGKPDLSMGLNGILGGLVGITACCDCMSNVQAALIIGPVAAALVVAGVILLDKLHIDDPVGAFPVHGMCGVWGCLAIGILPNGYLEAGATSFLTQLKGTAVICAWSFVTMFALFSLLKAIGILRVSKAEEQQGLDISEHGMQAYSSH